MKLGRWKKFQGNSKSTVNCTVSELVKTFNNLFPKFVVHVFKTTHQYNSTSAIRKNLKENEVYVVMDFSQNYFGKTHKEIQSANYGASKNQISLHTEGYYWKAGSSVEFEAFVLAPDFLSHNPCAVSASLTPVLKKIKEDLPYVDIIHFQSDGPSTQYKNKTNFYLLEKFSKDFNLKFSSWNFTAAGHGKSVVDAIGSTVKEMCNQVINHGIDILNARDLVNYIENNRQICAYLINDCDIEPIKTIFPEKFVVAPGTMKMHQVVWAKEREHELHFRYVSCAECTSNLQCCHFDMPESNIEKKTKKIPKKKPINFEKEKNLYLR